MEPHGVQHLTVFQEQDGARRLVFQLADVARPVERRQRPDGAA